MAIIMTRRKIVKSRLVKKVIMKMMIGQVLNLLNNLQIQKIPQKK